MIDDQIQRFRDQPNLYRQPGGSNAYFGLKSKSHGVEAELNSIALRKEWGWLQVLWVPKFFTMMELEFILGKDLLEMRLLRPNHLIACFTSFDTARNSVCAINSRYGVLKMPAELLDEQEVFKLLAKDGCKLPHSDCTQHNVNN